jgi:NADPH:quinone reductase-like Zn-dependent oxidoreductase
MRRVVVPKAGDLSVFQYEDSPDPEPGAGEVCIAVEASGVNFADLVARMGQYQDAPPFPMGLGYEVSGTVCAVGPDVDPSWLGCGVVSLVEFTGYATHAIVPVGHLAKRPEGMTAAEGAAIPVTGLTAWMMLEVMGRVRAGDRVLVHSGGGGVGLMALDLLKWRGAYAIGTASKRKHEFLLERGYDEVIDYRTEDFEQALQGEEGLDLILDPVGGDSWAKGMRLLRSGGRLVMFGFSAQSQGKTGSLFQRVGAAWQIPWLKFNPVHLINSNIGVMGVNMARLWDEGERVTQWLEKVLSLWEEGVIRPVIHAEVPFEEVAEAHRILHDRENIGKVVLVQNSEA